MSRLYTPNTPAFAFVILIKNNGTVANNKGMLDAILFRQTCLDPINAAVIVIQVDENSPVDSKLASRPEFFFKYDGTSAIQSHVTRALEQIKTYRMQKYVCGDSNILPNSNSNSTTCE